MDGVRITDHAARYVAPLDQFLTLGEPPLHEAEWPDYGAAFGIGPDHIDALIAMACDRELLEAEVDDPACWAPVHAWRALGGLRAAEAVVPLLACAGETDEHEWVAEELPIVFGQIGEAALAPLRACLCDGKRAEPGRLAAVLGIREIAGRHTGSRDACISILTDALAPEAAVEPWVAGFVVSGLLDLKAVEAIDAIRQAFGRDAVEPTVAGDLEDVEIELGLRAERSTKKPHYYADYAARMDRLQNLVIADEEDFDEIVLPVRTAPKIGRNEACPCGSGKKYKKCCLGK